MPARREGKVRYAVVGLGYISQVAVLPAFRHAENSELAALVSDDEVKRTELGKDYGVSRTCSYEGYDALLASGQVDAVYIALPNSMHRGFTLRAAAAGRHVLCEKPMALSEEDCEAMIEAAQRNRVKLMVAYRLHFERANLEAVEIAGSGKIGDLRYFASEFSMRITDPENIRLRRDLGGGPLWDLGVYCINAARYLFQDEPVEACAFATRGSAPPFQEVEEMTAAVLRFPGDRLAQFTCSFGAADAATYRLVGTEGVLRVDSAYEYAERLKYSLTIDGKTEEHSFRKSDQFAPELVYFSDCIRNDREPEPSGREGLADVRVIRALYRSVEEGRPIVLAPFQKANRPGLEQAIRRRPVRPPDLVNSRAPSE
jgi:glucose-fructose oxidoreductase